MEVYNNTASFIDNSNITTPCVVNSVKPWNFLGDIANKSQYFNPLFSWFVVAYTYIAVGRSSGTIWKYLFIVTSFGFIANVLDIVKVYFYERNDRIETFSKFNMIQTYFYGLNEWGFVYINFCKIRTCIKLLRNKIWVIFMYLFLVYTMFCRTMIGYHKMDEEVTKYRNKFNCISNQDTTKTENSTRFHTSLYIPIGVIEIILISFVVHEYFNGKSEAVRNELSTLFHSTLFRTLIVSVIYILIAINVSFDNTGHIAFERKLLWRIKGMFGIIFLVDLLLLKIDLDISTLKLQKVRMESKGKDSSILNSPQFQKSSDYEIDIDSPYSPSQNSSNRPLIRHNSKGQSIYSNNSLYQQENNIFYNQSLERKKLEDETNYSRHLRLL
ncbi:hypothetical protein BCR32DRAFT_294044 [Anaeromyces robustus]|uniref:Uncharacterized protein n=1 Tax=Anaeromyces robustus TaxID=1754192 RepID=A0A1Y1X430_9FUNG|nr:hypothetical protein BCR32DRAFT_294044 [Anaeromyces robustus]|eukprot:ORX80074.1 hypothetical protein BCR32DRAFT_294044 [Anaeromyces robustus]